METSFSFTGIPRLFFGPGTLTEVPRLCLQWGRNVLCITGKRSFTTSPYWKELQEAFDTHALHVETEAAPHEPSPGLVDSIAKKYRGYSIDIVVAIGGGSVIDTGKAVAAMLRVPGSVKEYLEGVGDKHHPGTTVPCIAVPTTAGTGSEATKNAVLSEIGADGYKKSLRHDNFIPAAAILDPRLSLSCPRNVTAASGMDTITQLLEAYCSPKSSPLTDALARDGLQYAIGSFIDVCSTGAGETAARGAMAYASFLSGVVLAHAGLGIVHGLASAAGGMFPVPHGVVCATLLPSALRVTIDALKRERSDRSERALSKYSSAGALLRGESGGCTDEDGMVLVDTLYRWIGECEIPRLGEYGVTTGDIAAIVARSSNKNNPIALSDTEIAAVVAERI
jgi:alcohol dehydrogenase class IV